MMNKLLLPVALAATLIMPSCASVQSARDKLEDMSEVEYQDLNQRVYNAGYEAGNRLEDLLIDNRQLLVDIRTLAVHLQSVVENDELNVNDVIVYLVDRFADDLGLEERYQEYIRDGAKVIDAAVGQIRLGIDGTLTEREKGLLLSLLRGLAMGTT